MCCRLKAWPRLTAISTIDPNLVRIRLDIASKNADLHERGIALLFGLLGYASFWSSSRVPDTRYASLTISTSTLAIIRACRL
jgi:hypothetical protein